MPITYGPGAALPTVGTPAYSAAQQGTGFVSAASQQQSAPASSPSGGGSSLPSIAPTTTSAPSGGGNSGGGNSGGGGISSSGAVVPGSTSNTTVSGANPGAAGGAGYDPGYAQAESDITPMSEDQIYSYWAGKTSSIVAGIQNTAAMEESNAALQNNLNVGSVNADLASRGMVGTTGSVLNTQDQLQYQQQIAQAENDKNTALAQIAQQIMTTTSAEYQNQQDTVAPAYIANRNAQTTQTLKGMSQQGISLTDLQTSNPGAYDALLQNFNGDPNALAAAYALNVPVNQVQQSWTNGSMYYQLSTNPITGAPTVHQFDLGFTPPTQWTQTKVGTNAVVMTDPSNPLNTITYTTNPFTGQVSITGTGSGAQFAAQANQTSGSTTPTTGATTASTTVSSALGADPTTPLSSVIQSVGIPAIVDAIIKNEGSSPAGVQNNPGNIKYTGAPGQTDSGVKAEDGGTFANYPSMAAGQAAIGVIVNNAGQGIDKSYGQNPTLQDFVNTYTGQGGPGTTGNASTAQGVGTNGLPIAEYGLLANVQGFDPSGSKSSVSPGVDAAAFNYINQYLNGTQPSASSVGVSLRTGSGAAFNAIAQRADDVYFQATGQHLPNLNTLKSNLGLIGGNNKLLNTLGYQTQTIQSNFGISLQNLTSNDINSNSPAINGFINSVQQMLGDPSVAQYLSQNETLSNEMSSLLALKNASGTTVQDKLSAAGLLPVNSTPAQAAQIIQTLMKEAQNANSAIQMQNINLYQSTDPLQLNPQNPLNQTITMQAPNGSQAQFTPGSLSYSDLQSAINDGYTMIQQ